MSNLYLGKMQNIPVNDRIVSNQYRCHFLYLRMYGNHLYMIQGCRSGPNPSFPWIRNQSVWLSSQGSSTQGSIAQNMNWWSLECPGKVFSLTGTSPKTLELVGHIWKIYVKKTPYSTFSQESLRFQWLASASQRRSQGKVHPQMPI